MKKTHKPFTVKYKTKRYNTINVTKFVHKIGNDTSYSIYTTAKNFKVILSLTQSEGFL